MHIIGGGCVAVTNSMDDTVILLDLDTLDTPGWGELARVPMGLNPVELEGPHHAVFSPREGHRHHAGDEARRRVSGTPRRAPVPGRDPVTRVLLPYQRVDTVAIIDVSGNGPAMKGEIPLSPAGCLNVPQVELITAASSAWGATCRPTAARPCRMRTWAPSWPGSGCEAAHATRGHWDAAVRG